MQYEEPNQKHIDFLSRLYERFSAVYRISLTTDSYEELRANQAFHAIIPAYGDCADLYRHLFRHFSFDGAPAVPGDATPEQIFFHAENRAGVMEPSDGSRTVYDYRILKLSDTESTMIILPHSQSGEDELAGITQTKNMIISNMSHEIRTPINAVLGMNEMILREATDPAILSYASDIRNAGQSILSILSDILDFSQIETGKIKIVPHEYNTFTMLTDIYSMISIFFKEKALAFHTDIDPRLPSMLYGDELRIKQIIMNLLTNAVKYTREGTVTLSIHYVITPNGTPALKVTVQDTGIGIKPENLRHIFTAYEHIDAQRRPHIEGTGLGISIIMRLLAQMDSRLEVESEYGKGSVFSFLLPQKVVRNTPIGLCSFNTGAVIIQSPANQTGELYAPSARVLAVDDNRVNLTVLKGLLKKNGIVPDCANSGRECLQLLRKKTYDFVFLDHLMPEMDGIETLRQIRQLDGGNRLVPVVALTANVMYGAKDRYLAAGFTDFLEKPIRVDALEKTLSTYLPLECLEKR